MCSYKFLLAAILLFAMNSSAQQLKPAEAPTTLDQVVDRMIEHEHALVKNLDSRSPVVETYIQNMRPDKELGSVPENDQYFLRRLDMMNNNERSFLGRTGRLKKIVGGMKRTYSMEFDPIGFSWMVFADKQGFDRKHYDFTYLRREFLGDLRCMVFDVVPKKDAGEGRFNGRVWAEDQDYNIVRLNGMYTSAGHGKYFFHFDSWRLNMQPGLWLPAYVYSEESKMQYGIRREVSFKAQTRLWGYNLKHAASESELTQVLVDSPGVKDQSAAAQDASPVQSQRLWEQQAENNVLEKLQQSGLLAPAGEMDKVLETVVNNIEITNNLDTSWPVHCRVLLTAPLESFHVGHTIVVSRGLLDTLPDETSLAMVLSHELGHIVLGHQVDSKFAFSDRMLFSNEATYQNFGFSHNEQEEHSADKKAIELLQKSPYKDKLASAGLFLKALSTRSSLSGLLTPHLGNPLANGKGVLRMPELMSSAPALEVGKLNQIPALPLGGRVKIDPWSDRAELTKAPALPLASAREKMIFEVTPVFPHLSRQGTESNVAEQPQSAYTSSSQPLKSRN
jgi:hypothetical protein